MGKVVKLKRCPFCGGDAELDDKSYSFGKDEAVIQCSGSDCEVIPTTHYYLDKEKAIKAWNKRTTHP